MKYVSLDQIDDQSVSHNAAIRKKVMLTAGELPSLTQFAQAYFAPGQIANAHQHSDMHEVFFVQSGNGQMVIDGNCYELSPGMYRCFTRRKPRSQQHRRRAAHSHLLWCAG